VSGQWRVLQDGRLTLLRQSDESLFPPHAPAPAWLARKLVSSESSDTANSNK
jgi:hypothetical protein